MANSRNSGKRGDPGRAAGGFIALPWSVVDCPAYAALSHPARSLLLELARQFVRDNNGRLLASAAYLAKRGWTSSDVITRAKRDLVEAGFIHETVKGARPNKASWYAVTWRTLDRHSGYDEGAVATFVRAAYENASLRPSRGVEARSIAPSRGVAKPSPTPSHGAIRAISKHLSTPSHGDHLEKPSPATEPATATA
ncbi:MAG: hypothetical protein EOP74_00175 [Variovorax sp.]|nr:MAG: hypothetical protein EOP74_00175 [Variovorax sp.]